MPDVDLLRIGQLAELANVTPRTIRFYIQEKLLPQPVRIHKTMALYSRDCVEKIKAIKDAQSKYFLPLMVIRNILEQNEYDYSSLAKSAAHEIIEEGSHPTTATSKVEADLSIDAVSNNLGIPQETISLMAGNKWIKLDKKGKESRIRPSDFEFLEQVSTLHKNGVDFSEQMRFFESIQDIIEKGVEQELEILIKSLIKKPNQYFNDTLAVEGQVVQHFINKIRERCLQEYFQTYTELMDNAYFASVDEGFALPAEEIEEDLESLGASMGEAVPDVQRLVWMSTGYSCVGDLKHSLDCLHQALKMEPDHLEAKVKMIWYKRFTQRRQDVKRLRKQLIDLVRANTKHTLGHVFLVDWFVLDALASDSASGIIESIKLCLDEIQKMEQAIPQNLHDWALVQYTKGRVYTTFPLLQDEYIEKGVVTFETLLERSSELEKYYSNTMPFFPKWLWPNVLYVLGTSYLKLKRFSEARQVFKKARSYKVAFPFRERLKKGLADAEKGLGMSE
jgi:DNA-binding transcriptional MerR regulator